MRRFAVAALLPLAALLTAAGVREHRESQERAAIEAAVYDYVDALYRVEPSRVERSVHPELTKRGFHRPQEGAPYRELKMTYTQLRDLAGSWNREGRVDPARAVREVTVLDALDQTASAKLVADWGVDYLHLAKYDGRWQIVNVLWQSPPPPLPTP
ncbi:MAG TPA: nuclear transport factor 2 family protein [Longimicrobiaceae bacterium]|nr:nuclear transport factor 2 family protein [Longimicrobiaceae bacterium]